MNNILIYGSIFVLLVVLELLYFRIARRFNISDTPSARSSHSTVVLSGGGIIFLLGAWLWSAFFGFHYLWFLIGLTVVCGVSFGDDIHSLPDSTAVTLIFVSSRSASKTSRFMSLSSTMSTRALGA